MQTRTHSIYIHSLIIQAYIASQSLKYSGIQTRTHVHTDKQASREGVRSHNEAETITAIKCTKAPRGAINTALGAICLSDFFFYCQSQVVMWYIVLMVPKLDNLF